MTCLAFTNL